jgi:hypothetical protein
LTADSICDYNIRRRAIGHCENPARNWRISARWYLPFDLLCDIPSTTRFGKNHSKTAAVVRAPILAEILCRSSGILASGVLDFASVSSVSVDDTTHGICHCKTCGGDLFHPFAPIHHCTVGSYPFDRRNIVLHYYISPGTRCCKISAY